jgi:ribosomal protein S20
MKHLTLITIIKEVLQENNSLTEEKILIPRRSPEERRKNFIKATQQKIQQYIKNGSKGDLDLRNTPITSLPDNLKQVGGYLDLSNTPITSLPDNLKHVGGYLDLYNTPITKLPDNLTVGGWLDLNNTPITSLPDNLTVGGDLNLNYTSITTLPDNLNVGGNLDLYNTKITSLPDNLTVGGDLNLNNTPITKLPDNLTVGGDLWLYNTKITTIPASAKISGKIYGLKQENIMKKSELKQLIKEVLNEVPEEKDKQRIKDMFTKSKGSDEKLLQLAKNMAKSIDDGLKAFRRGEAADVLLGPEDNELSKIFYDRAKELGYEKQEIDEEIK